MLKEHLDICREEDDSNILQLRSLENYESDDEEKDNNSDYINNSNMEGIYYIKFCQTYFEEKILDKENDHFR